jgi:hypothetical protein
MLAAENKVWYLHRSRLFERIGADAVENCEHLFTQTTNQSRRARRKDFVE